MLSSNDTDESMQENHMTIHKLFIFDGKTNAGNSFSIWKYAALGITSQQSIVYFGYN